MFSGASGAARLSVIVVVTLIIIKVVTGIITGSLSVLAQAADSFLDLFAVAITLAAVRFSAKPADAEHPFGHGKAENVAAVVQAVLIFVAGGSIIYSAIQRGLSQTALETTEAGIAVMAVAVIASFFLSRHLRKVARQEDSLALAANADNLNADIYSSLVVLAGLIIVRFTGLYVIDSILAGLVALFILKVGLDVLRTSFGGLVDVQLPEEEVNAIRDAITEHTGIEVVEFHKLRTRKAGSHRYVDVHLVMPKSTSLATAHDMTEHLEIDIRQRLRNTDVTIHVEPCDDNCTECGIIACKDRKS